LILVLQHKISPVPPTEYGNRFFAFIRAIMRGGEGGARFKAE
jgi:1-phosphatidylinositol-4-phosphate 5-kinase